MNLTILQLYQWVALNLYAQYRCVAAYAAFQTKVMLGNNSQCLHQKALFQNGSH